MVAMTIGKTVHPSDTPCRWPGVLYHNGVFSSITSRFDLPTNRLYRLRDELRRKQIRITDLVSGNLNDQGIFFPMGLLQKALAAGARASRSYRPDPLGQAPAREAVSRFYAGQGLKIPIDQILLTPGTSVSYWYAFKLLADVGDEILAPVPSYPLFDSIAALCGVKLTPYRLRERARWEIDFDVLEAAITPRTKAIVLISPHNPTGAVATEDEIQRLEEIAVRRGLAIISDEVFSSFIFTSSPRRKSGPSRLGSGFRRNDVFRPAASLAPLVLTMNGLSKMLALPGMKIGWMAVTGDPALVKKALKTLEMISDTFLPVHEPAQFSLPLLLKTGAAFQKSYVREVRKRLGVAVDILRQSGSLSFTEPEGGFFLTTRLVNNGTDEEEIACQLLQEHRILIHPGYFYDLEGGHLVLSFVSQPTVLRKALKHLQRDIIGRIR